MSSSCYQRDPSWYVLDSNIFGTYSPHTKWCNALLLFLWVLFLVVIIWALTSFWQSVVHHQQKLDQCYDQSFYEPIF